MKSVRISEACSIHPLYLPLGSDEFEIKIFLLSIDLIFLFFTEKLLLMEFYWLS